MPTSRITLLTDFGLDGPYVAAMKGVIWSHNPLVEIVDITHAVPPQDVRQGAWLWAEASPWFPPGTLHVGVVDPGVGGSRKLIYAELGDQRYLAPDNGLLSCLALRRPPSTIRRLSDSRWWLPRVSSTFHGRDILAPLAARLSLGLPPEELGPAETTLVTLAWPEASAVPGKITGEVVAIDSFGNLVTNVTAEQLAGVPTGEELQVLCDEHETRGLFRTYSDQPEMTLIALVGSSGRLEIALVGDNAARMLSVKVGTPVELSWA